MNPNRPPTVAVLESTAFNFPAALRDRDGASIFPRTWAIGDLAILEKRLLGLFCSIQCPGEVILWTYDLARALRDAGVPVIGGFHSPMEKECLALLLRGKQPVVICPARSVEQMRFPRMWQEGVEDGRFLLLSPFAPAHRRVTASLAEQRNRLVAYLAYKVFVAYAAPRSRTERFCLDLLRQGKEVVTFDCSTNVNFHQTWRYLPVSKRPDPKPLAQRPKDFRTFQGPLVVLFHRALNEISLRAEKSARNKHPCESRR